MADPQSVLEKPLSSAPRKGLAAWWKVILLLMVVLAGVLLLHFTPLNAWLKDWRSWRAELETFGWGAPLVFLGAGSVLIILGCPRLLLCSISGIIFGFWYGILWSETATLIGYYITFIWVRWAGREAATRKWPLVNRYAEQLGRGGWKVVLLTRVLPIHGMLVNAALAMTQISHREFLWATAVGLLFEGIPAVLVGTGLGQANLVNTLTYIGMAVAFLVVAPIIFARYRKIVAKEDMARKAASTQESAAAQKRDFDKEAAQWDENPARVKMAQDVAQAIAQAVQLTKDMDVLDYGCGTGLLMLNLQPKVKSIAGMDSSAGMLGVLSKKVAAQDLKNVRVALIDPDGSAALPGKFDLIVSSMVLHHVQDVPRLLAKLRDALKPGGSICLADLDSDGGKFHADPTGVFHEGFDRAELSKSLEAAGFGNVRHTTAAEVVKPGKDGVLMRFTIFLVCGQA